VSDRIRFELKDYREVEGRFDLVVSVGMFKHTGVHRYGEFFPKINNLMNDKGVALIHSIGHMGPLGTASKYIFRGA